MEEGLFVSYKISLDHWKERIVARLAEDSRLINVLDNDTLYQGISRSCLKLKDPFTSKEKEIAKTVLQAGCLGYGKRYIAKICGLSYIQAQQYLEQFYKVFYKTRSWIKSFGREELERYVNHLEEKVLKESLERALKTMPKEWSYLSELTFQIPSYAYDVQVEKFLRHYFEREISINDTLVRLPINIEALRALKEEAGGPTPDINQKRLLTPGMRV